MYRILFATLLFVIYFTTRMASKELQTRTFKFTSNFLCNKQRYNSVNLKILWGQEKVSIWFFPTFRSSPAAPSLSTQPFHEPKRMHRVGFGVDDDSIWKCNLSIVTFNFLQTFYSPANSISSSSERTYEEFREQSIGRERSKTGENRKSRHAETHWQMFWHAQRTSMVFFDHVNWIHRKSQNRSEVIGSWASWERKLTRSSCLNWTLVTKHNRCLDK